MLFRSCGEVIAAALRAAGDPSDREAIWAIATDPGSTVDTAFGPVSFDAKGDIRQRWVALYRTDPTIDADPATPGAGDWIFVDQVATGDAG